MMSKRILLGVCGGIAAYKAAELTRQLVKLGHTVEVVMSQAATRFVTPMTFQALSGHAVYSDLWDERPDNAMAHIDLSRRADAFIIAPASANMLFKLAHGACDDLISTLAAARTCPLLVAPAMNVQMWQNPANQRNIAQLRADGVQILGPANGVQACGETGDGRMLEPADIVELLGSALRPALLAGQRVLLTAGPTQEPIDTVRAITNLSSGKMGYALARACRDAGAHVTLISGPTALNAPTGVAMHYANTAQQMLECVMAQVPQTDIFISVAAVADYYVKNVSEHKIKKTTTPPNIELAENPDILATVASLPHAPFCVGFAAESQNLLSFAETKRQRKRLPLLVANLAQQAMGAEDNQVTLLDDQGSHPLPILPKPEVAWAIVQHLSQLLKSAKPH